MHSNDATKVILKCSSTSSLSSSHPYPINMGHLRELYSKTPRLKREKEKPPTNLQKASLLKDRKEKCKASLSSLSFSQL